MRCEDYPCCGHTDGLPCDWTYTPEARAYDEKHAFCDHEAGVCDLYDDNDDCDIDEDSWCYTHDQESHMCGDDNYEIAEDAGLDSYWEDRLTTMFE